MSISNNGTVGNFLKATTSLPSVAGDWSFALWATNSLQAGTQGTFASFESATQFFQTAVQLNTHTSIYFSTALLTNFPGGAFVNGVWNFYGAVHTSAAGGATTLYRGVNGAALATVAGGVEAISFAMTGMALFTEIANDEPQLGAQVDFKFWLAALSAREMGNQYLAMQPRSRVDALERWLPMVDSSNPGEAYVGRGKNLTLTGSLPNSHSMPAIPWATPMIQ